MPDIDLLSKIKGIKTKNLDAYYKEQYKNWHANKKRDKDPFFLLYKDFDVHLKEISSGALRLFLFYGFHSKNKTGESWPSIDTISKYFNVSTRTVNSWNKELEDRGIISRAKTKVKSKTTYLLPFSMNFFSKKEKDISKFFTEEVHKEDFMDVYGEISKVFHMFQWRKTDNNNYNLPYHEIFIIASKSFPLGDYIQHTVFHYKINNYEAKVIEEKNFREDILIFNSPYKIDTVDVNIEGIAVNSSYNIKNHELLEKIISQLMDKDMDFSLFDRTSLVESEK